MAGPSRPQEPPARVNHAAEGHCFSAGSTVCRSAQSAFADPDAGQFAENNLHDHIGVLTCPGRCVNEIAGELPAFRKS